jgi:hypothetical protein
MPSTVSAPDPRETIEWDIRNTVTVEPGAPIPLESHTRVELQPGVHRLTSDQQHNDLAHYRLLGSGAECVVETDGNHRWLVKAFGAPGPIEVGGFVADYGEGEDTSGPGINLAPKGPLWVHDIRWTGFTPAEETGDDWKCNVRIKADAPGWVERVESIGSAHMGTHLVGKGMGIVDYHHEGELFFRDNYIELEPGDVPWYTQGHGTASHFIRCYHKNNAMANFRIGGQSSVRNCVSVQDHDAIDHYSGTYTAAHDCLVATQINYNQTGAVIEDCDFICRSTDTSSTSIRTHLTSGDVTIRDTRIQHDEGRPFIHKNADYGSDKYEWVDGEDSAIHWASVDISGAAGVEHVFDHDRREHCTLTDCCVEIARETLYTGDGTAVTGLEESDAEQPTEYDPRAATPFESDPDMPDETPSGDDSTDSAPNPYPHTFQIEGTGSRATWRVVVDGSLTHDSAQGTNDSEDTFGTAEANGVVLSGTDGGRFSGEITALELNGDATVFVDGDEVDPAEYGGADDDPSDGSDAPDGSDGSDGSDEADDGDDGSSGDDGSEISPPDVALADVTLADVAASVQQQRGDDQS